MAPVPLAQPIPLKRLYREDCAFAEITHFANNVFTYRIGSLTEERLPWPTTISIHKTYAKRGTEVAWRRACDHVKYGTSRHPGPARIILRENARQKAFRVRVIYGDLLEEDVDDDCWYRRLKVNWEDRCFETKVKVPKASIKKEVDAVLAVLKERAEAVPSIEVVEEVQEVRRTVVFTVPPQKGRRHKMEVWRVDGQGGSSLIGTVVGYEKFEDGSKKLTVRVDVEGIEGLLLQGVIPDRMFSAQFWEVEDFEEEQSVDENSCEGVVGA
jgi:hypothetical protein